MDFNKVTAFCPNDAKPKSSKLEDFSFISLNDKEKEENPCL